MTREQFLLLKLAEECQEVAKRAIKQIQFGANQVWLGGEVKDGVGPKNPGLTNMQRLRDELVDLSVVAGLFADSGMWDDVPDVYEHYEATRSKKIEKLNKYLEFARSLGQIDGDWKV